MTTTHITLLVSLLFPAIATPVGGRQVPAAQDSSQEPWQMQVSGVTASLRGLFVVDNQIVWASGSDGTVIRTTDGGKSWSNVSPMVAIKLDFRDIHAFDANRAVILSAGQPARVYRTSDAGKSWKITFEHPNKKSFFDAISFWDEKHGIAMSDPIDSNVLLIETRDGGKNWAELDLARRPEALRGEAGFAASGTNMIVAGETCLIALGGAEKGQREPTSRIVFSNDRGKTWKSSVVPIERSESSGIFSIAFSDDNNGVVVGGDYLNPNVSSSNIAITSDGGKTWSKPNGQPPGGYRSCVVSMKHGDSKNWLSVGPDQTDISHDGGCNWKPASDIGFHAVAFSQDGKFGWASGSGGRIAKWTK